MTHGIFHTEKDKLFVLKEGSKVDRIFLECRLTEYLQERVERCNLHLKNFQLRSEVNVGDTYQPINKSDLTCLLRAKIERLAPEDPATLDDKVSDVIFRIYDSDSGLRWRSED